MSLINQVLLDLDRRQASPAALPGVARSIAMPRRDLRWVRWVGLLLTLGAGLAIAVVATQAMPEARRAPTAALTLPIALPAAPSSPTLALASQQSAAALVSKTPPSTMAVVDTETETAIHPAMSSAAPVPVEHAPALPGAVIAATVARTASAESTMPMNRVAGSLPAARAAPAEPTASASPAPVATNLEKRARALTARERAEVEYQRGLALHQQGQLAEAQSAFGAALREDPRYGPARHAVALGLLADANVKAARALLAQGLELNPQDALLASTLARISADEDLAGAIALLKAALPSRAGTSARTESAEARALLATLQQRIGNHDEAIDNYGTALRVAPDNGAWWIGLGISLAAAGRVDSARQAFEQARSTDTLSPELVRYVEQRLASSAR